MGGPIGSLQDFDKQVLILVDEMKKVEKELAKVTAAFSTPWTRWCDFSERIGNYTKEELAKRDPDF